VNKVIRVATYTRVSIDMQVKGKSIAAQQAEMREFAAARGWEVVVEFVDPGLSGTNMNRPGLEAVLAAAEEHAFDILLVHELSRLSRRIYDTFHIFDKLGKLDVGFASVKEPNFDFSTATGRLFLTILAALNQYYIDLLKMHTSKSKRERAREGLYNASITPYGYRHTGDADTPPVIVEEEAKGVLGMFELYGTGKHSYRETAEWLNDAGCRARSGRRFSKDTVADMIRNPFYKGFVAYHRGSRAQDAAELFPGKHEAIVSSELWDKCRRVREQRRGAPRTYQPKYRAYLLNGIVVCDVCGRKLRAQGANERSYYREMSSQRGFVDCPSSHKGIRTKIVDGQVGAIFRYLRLPEDWQEQMEELLEQDDDRQTLENRHTRLIAERRRLKEMKIRGEFDDDLDIYDREQARVRRELAELPAPADTGAIERAATMLEDLAKVWDQAELADQRDLLRIAVREVKVDVPQGRVVTIEPYPVFVPLFRQVPLLREVSFGIFTPLWSLDLAEKMGVMSTLPPLTEAFDLEEASDWPLIAGLPVEIVGVRITPVLSDWLKKRRKGKQGIGRVAELIRPGALSLTVDRRKWPEIKVERIRDLEALPDDAISFLWTPFALQRAQDKTSLIEEAKRVLEGSGMWGFVDVMPASMPGHWLYQYFPQAWESEKRRTWDTSQMYNMLIRSGFEVELERRSIYQPVALGVALQIAHDRDRCPQLAFLADAVYDEGLARLEETVEQEGKYELMGSEFCLVEVRAVSK